VGGVSGLPFGFGGGIFLLDVFVPAKGDHNIAEIRRE